MKKKILLSIFTITLLLLFLSVSSCKGDNPTSSGINPPPPPPTSGKIVLKKNVKILTSTARSKVSSLTSNSVTFSGGNGEINSFKVGDYILSTPTTGAPKGFMRKISGIQKIGGINSGITISTTYAPLNSFIKSGKLDFNKRIFSYTKNKTLIIFDADGNNSTKYDQTSVNTSVSLLGDVLGNFSFNGSPTFDLSVVISGNINVDIISSIKRSFNKKYHLYGQIFPAIVVFATPPVVIVPRLGFYIKVEGDVDEIFKTGFRDNAKLTLNSSYYGQLNFSKNFQNNFSKKETVIYSDGNLKIKLGIEASFVINEIVGPSLGLEPYGELDALKDGNPTWILYAGLDGTYGIRTGWFSFGLIPEKTWNYQIIKKEIARSVSSNKPPTAVINLSPSSGITTETNIQFSNLSSIDDITSQSNLVGRWDFENDGTWDTGYESLGYSYHKYSQQGTYKVKLEVKDEGSLTGTSTKNIYVSQSKSDKTLILQPGPEGKDANVVYYKAPNGNESFSGISNEKILWVNYEVSSGIVKMDALFEFDGVSKIPPNSKIKSAKFKIYGFGVVNYDEIPKISLVKLDKAWEESNVKWNNKPSYTSISDKEFTYKGQSHWYEFDITSISQSWVNGESNYGIGLTTEQNTFYGEIFSGDNDDSSKRPILEITYQ